MNMHKKLILLLAVVAVISGSSLQGKFLKSKTTLLFKRFFGSQRTPMKAITIADNKNYTLFNGQELTKHHRFINLHQNYFDRSLYKYINTNIEKGSDEYNNVMGEFKYTNKAKDVRPMWVGDSYTFKWEDAFNEK